MCNGDMIEFEPECCPESFVLIPLMISLTAR